ncbi:MAG: hypothetical protein WCT31_03365 [Candidatus Micrarchaeia archaeon]
MTVIAKRYLKVQDGQKPGVPYSVLVAEACHFEHGFRSIKERRSGLKEEARVAEDIAKGITSIDNKISSWIHAASKHIDANRESGEKYEVRSDNVGYTSLYDAARCLNNASRIIRRMDGEGKKRHAAHLAQVKAMRTLINDLLTEMFRLVKID